MNPNLLWAEIVVNELANCGLKAVCIAPGSRSTPLTLAFDRHPDIELYLHLDERSAAFFALGMALATDRPVALVCTSGTATAEFHAAIIEAHQSHIPLLILTSDRPPELRHSGANQTVDQVKMYGDHVLWAVDVALPESEPPAIALRNLQTLACRACAKANGLVKGVVHLNFPFRKPLEPASIESMKRAYTGRAYTHFQQGIIQPTDDQIKQLIATIEQHERGLIVCGPSCPDGEFPQVVATLAKISGYPILADPLSGVRFGSHVKDAPIVGSYEMILNGDGPNWAQLDVVIRFGAVPTSKWLNSYLNRVTPMHHIHIRENGIWADESHLINCFLQAEPVATCQQLLSVLTPRSDSEWISTVMATERACWNRMEGHLEEEFFDGAIVAKAVKMLPLDAHLFMGNSLPIRHLDQFGCPSPKDIRTFANRGASGIDGTTSTALGIAAASDKPLIFITGDISFYHDLNGLLAIKQHNLTNVTIVLLNNDGGSIFRRLPIANIEPPFTKLFVTPHGLDFEPVVRMYGLDYIGIDNRQADSRQAFCEAFAQSVSNSVPTVIEVRTDGIRDYERQQEVVRAVRESMQFL